MGEPLPCSPSALIQPFVRLLALRGPPSPATNPVHQPLHEVLFLSFPHPTAQPREEALNRQLLNEWKHGRRKDAEEIR